MKLFTKEGFSMALQITSLILLIGYAASKSDEEPKENLPRIFYMVSQPDVLLKLPIHQLVFQNQVEMDNTFKPYFRLPHNPNWYNGIDGARAMKPKHLKQ